MSGQKRSQRPVLWNYHLRRVLLHYKARQMKRLSKVGLPSLILLNLKMVLRAVPSMPLLATQQTHPPPPQRIVHSETDTSGYTPHSFHRSSVWVRVYEVQSRTTMHGYTRFQSDALARLITEPSHYYSPALPIT